MSITIEFLDGLIKNNKKVPRNIVLKKPERDYLVMLQQRVWESLKDIEDDLLHQKRKEFNVSCDRLIYRKKVKA